MTVNGKEYPSLADGEYDAIVLGTGLKEVLLAGMLAKEQGKRVRADFALTHTGLGDLATSSPVWLDGHAAHDMLPNTGACH